MTDDLFSWAERRAPTPEDYAITDGARRWLEWERLNPAFYPLFCQFAAQAIRHGHSRLSAWLVVNMIRWETTIVTQGSEYKVSNEVIAYYSRMWLVDHPAYPDFFETKKMQEEPPKELFTARLRERRAS
jgi:hypothetical protein